MSKKPKAQSGYIIPEQQVYATYPVQPIQGYQQPQYLPVQQQQSQGQYLNQQQMPYQGSYTVNQDQAPQNQGGMSAGQVAGGIGQAAQTIGGIFDTIGDIRRGIITTGSSLLNALIPDNQNKKARSITYANSQDPYGNQTYNNMFENGGKLSVSKAKKMLKEGVFDSEKQRRYFGWVAGGRKAQSGATVTNYGANEKIPGLTPAQEAALNGFIPYTPEIQPIQQPVQNNYFTPLDNGQFAINTQRINADRTAASGNIADTYSYGSNRSFGFEGNIGNQSYNPTAYMNTGYNRYFENGGNINNTGYLQGTQTAQNPYNIIPGQNGMTPITTMGMNQPIYANGTPLMPNSGNYLFPTEAVVESKMYNIGDELDLSEQDIAALRQQGYDIEVG